MLVGFDGTVRSTAAIRALAHDLIGGVGRDSSSDVVPWIDACFDLIEAGIGG